MNNSRPIDDYLKQLNREITVQNRKWVDELMGRIATQAQVDVSQLSESFLSNAPDVEAIANDIFAQNIATSIIDDAVIDAVAVPTLGDIIDDSLLRTIVDTDFVEAFLENFREAVAANSVATLCAEKLTEFAAQTDDSSYVEERVRMLAEQFGVTEDFGKYVAELAELNEFDAELDRFMKRLVADTKLTSLLGERIGELAKTSEPLKSLDQVMQDIAAQADFGCLNAEVRKELNRSYKRAVARLVQDVETQSYRHLPWEKFLDLTYGILADDPIERPRVEEPGLQDELE